MKTIKLSDKEIELIVWELEQGVLGDSSSFDNRLQRLIKKFEEAE